MRAGLYRYVASPFENPHTFVLIDAYRRACHLTKPYTNTAICMPQAQAIPQHIISLPVAFLLVCTSRLIDTATAINYYCYYAVSGLWPVLFLVVALVLCSCVPQG